MQDPLAPATAWSHDPTVRQPISCHKVETVTVSTPWWRSTTSTRTSGSPSSTSHRSQGSVFVGATAHPVALDNVEVLEIDQWLALLIIGDLDPYTQPITPRAPLPTGSAKSHLCGSSDLSVG